MKRSHQVMNPGHSGNEIPAPSPTEGDFAFAARAVPPQRPTVIPSRPSHYMFLPTRVCNAVLFRPLFSPLSPQESRRLYQIPNICLISLDTTIGV